MGTSECEYGEARATIKKKPREEKVAKPKVTIEKKKGFLAGFTNPTICELKVTNDSGIELHNVTVTDTKLGIDCNCAQLGPDKSVLVQGMYGPATEDDLPGPIQHTTQVTNDETPETLKLNFKIKIITEDKVLRERYFGTERETRRRVLHCSKIICGEASAEERVSIGNKDPRHIVAEELTVRLVESSAKRVSGLPNAKSRGERIAQDTNRLILGDEGDGLWNLIRNAPEGYLSVFRWIKKKREDLRSDEFRRYNNHEGEQQDEGIDEPVGREEYEGSLPIHKVTADEASSIGRDPGDMTREFDIFTAVNELETVSSVEDVTEGIIKSVVSLVDSLKDVELRNDPHTDQEAIREGTVALIRFCASMKIISPIQATIRHLRLENASFKEIANTMDDMSAGAVRTASSRSVSLMKRAVRQLTGQEPVTIGTVRRILDRGGR